MNKGWEYLHKETIAHGFVKSNLIYSEDSLVQNEQLDTFEDSVVLEFFANLKFLVFDINSTYKGTLL